MCGVSSQWRYQRYIQNCATAIATGIQYRMEALSDGWQCSWQNWNRDLTCRNRRCISAGYASSWCRMEALPNSATRHRALTGGGILQFTLLTGWALPDALRADQLHAHGPPPPCGMRKVYAVKMPKRPRQSGR